MKFPLTLTEAKGGGYTIKDADGIAIAYCHYREGEEAARIVGAMTRQQAKEMAQRIARLLTDDGEKE